MNRKNNIRYLLICVYCLSSCSLNNRNIDSSIKFKTVEQNKYLILDTLRFLIPKDENISLDNVYMGIIESKKNSFERHKSLIINNYAFLTTSEDLGRGIRSYLYVFDIRNKSLIRDSLFKHNYLYSSAGIFVIDRSTLKIFSVDKPDWYDAKQEEIIPASISSIKGYYFEYLKVVYKIGVDIPSDSSLVSFFYKSMLTNDKEVFELPKDWWKSK